MKQLFIILGIFISVSSFSQNKNDILVELENKISEHIEISKDDIKIYYSVSEKILDFETKFESYQGLQVPLGNTSIIYEYNLSNEGEDWHRLTFKCKDSSECMKNKISKNVKSVSIVFPSKRLVYEIIDLIYKLKQI